MLVSSHHIFRCKYCHCV